jgi:hypothetical protein
MSQLAKRQGKPERSPAEFIRDFFNKKMLSPEIGVAADVVAVRFAEQAYFSLRLTKNGTVSLDPVFSGLYSAGRPSQAIAGWVDGDYFDLASFPDGITLSLAETGFDFQLFKTLGELVPAGGSFMVSYSLFSKESKIHTETKRGLDREYPPVVTPLGFLLFAAGCGMSFKDWYFAEGGREGPGKLQGYKPIDSDVVETKAKSMLEEVRTFANRPQKQDDDLSRACKLRAHVVIRELEKLIS